MNYLWNIFLSMPLWLQLFLGTMIILTVAKCWIKKEDDDKILKRYKLIVSLISIFTCLTGAYYLNDTLPSPASPQINHLFFWGAGNLQRFRYCCEFEVRNDGETPCSLEKVEYIFDGTVFTDAKSGQAKVSSGGGSRGMYRGMYGGGGGSVTIDVGSSIFPQSLSMIPQGFCVFGEAENPAGDTTSVNDIKDDVEILVNFTFITDDGKAIVKHETVKLIYGSIQGVRL